MVGKLASMAAKRERGMRMWRFESEMAIGHHQRGTQPVLFAGVDEVGRGCLAGPVIAAAVVRPACPGEWVTIYDSKTTSAQTRLQMYQLIRDTAQGIGVGVCTPEEIDSSNILAASRVAMGRALRELTAHLGSFGHENIDVALIDGLYSALSTNVACLPVVDGDARCTSIAAASIVAKVIRDRQMEEYDEVYPGYGFGNNVGYGTPEHTRALRQLGPTPIHRFSFSPVAAVAQIGLGV